MRSILKNTRIVTPNGDFNGYVVIENEMIVDIQKDKTLSEGQDLRGCWLIPGCIDIHSDYWESEIRPRPSANFPLEMAFHFMDQRAAACGLTSVFSAISFSDDVLKGRTLDAALEKSKALGALAQDSLVRHFVHLRLSPNSDGVLATIPAIQALEALKLVVFNDDIPGQRQFTFDFVVERHAKNHGLSKKEAQAVIEAKIAELSQINHRGAIQQALGDQMILGSHDDTFVAHVDEAHQFGCALSEMPTTIEAARRAKALGMWVCMGAPNLVRGGSHCGNLSSIDAWSEGLVDIFCSDYHFPTLLAGVIKLMEMGVSPSQAINTVSLNPAQLLGMDHELGSIEVGKKADLVAFQPKGSFGLVETVWVNGEKRFFAGSSAL